MAHVMIDLETLGTQPGSVILSIGAVVFDPEASPNACIKSEFYTVVSRADCEAKGLTVSENTLKWWGQQSEEARKVLVEAESTDAKDLMTALQELARFIPFGSKVWSNGANFDQPLLDVAYDRVGITLPWKYWNSRCYRTILALCPNEESMQPGTVLAHDALEDAKWQAKHMVNMARVNRLKL